MTEKQIRQKREKLLAEIKQHATNTEVTQADLAERTGFTQSNISRMFEARFPPTLDNLLKLCDALDLSIQVVKSKK